MAVGNGALARQAGEETPLLRDQRRGDSDGASEETLTDARRGVDEERGDEDDDKANQQVGRGRGLLIILSLWGLIFLQGKFSGALPKLKEKELDWRLGIGDINEEQHQTCPA